VLAFVANQSRIRTHHSSAPSRWLGAQTAESDCDWLKQLKRFANGAIWLKQKQFKNSFETVLLQFYVRFVSLLFPMCRELEPLS